MFVCKPRLGKLRVLCDWCSGSTDRRCHTQKGSMSHIKVYRSTGKTPADFAHSTHSAPNMHANNIVTIPIESLSPSALYQEEQARQRHIETMWAHERLWLLLVAAVFVLLVLTIFKDRRPAATPIQAPSATVEDLSTLRYLIAEDRSRDYAAIQRRVDEEARRAKDERAKRERDHVLVLSKFNTLEKAISQLRKQPEVVADPIEEAEPLGVPGSSKRTLVPLTRAFQPALPPPKRRTSLRLQRQATIPSIPSTPEQPEERELVEQLERCGILK